MKTETKTGRFAKGLVVGAVAGLLLAPQPGRQTRNLIRSKTGGYAVSLRERFPRNGAVEYTVDYAGSHAKDQG